MLPALNNAMQADDATAHRTRLAQRSLARGATETDDNASAASVTKNLTTKADLLMDQLRSGITAGAETGVVDGVAGMTVGERDNVQTGQTAEEGLTEFMDWALTVDSFNNFEDLFVDVNKSMDFWGVNPV